MYDCDVTLIHPNMYMSTDARMDFPLGLGYLAAALEEEGHSVTIADLSGVPDEEWSCTIKRAPLYGIMLYTHTYRTALRLRDFLKHRDSDCSVIVGGAHPTALPNETLEDFDAVVEGEGEVSFLQLIKAWKQGGYSIKGIWTAPPIQVLDSIPFPARHLVDYHSYHRRVEGERCASIMTSRGCPFHCAFCCKVLGRGIRFRSKENIIAELEQIIRDYGFRAFTFMDDLFSLRKDFYPLLSDIRELHITYRCHCRAGVNSFEDFKRLRASGCRVVAFGIESGSQRVLDILQKGTTVEQNTQAILDAKRAGLVTKAFMISGTPGETAEDVEETKRWFEVAQPDQFTLLQFIPLPGCRIFESPADYGITRLSDDWAQYFTIAGQYEGGIAFEVEGQSAEEMVDLREDLLGFLGSRKWMGEKEDYQTPQEGRRDIWSLGG